MHYRFKTDKPPFAGLTQIMAMLAIGASLTLAGCEPTEAPEAEAPAPRPVRYTVAHLESAGSERRFAGVARSGMDSRMSFRIAGSINRLGVKVGDQISKGSLIATLDDEDARLQVQQSEASLLRAEAEARNADNSYARIRALYENQSASRNELDGARAAFETSQALLASARKQLQLSRQQLSYTRLTAPAEGCQVAAVYVENNENVSPGQPVVELGCGELLEVHVPVPETFIANIQAGQPVQAHFDALPNRSFNGLVSEVGVAASGATTFPVIVSLTEPNAKLRAGMAAEVGFRNDDDGPGAIWLPTVAVLEDRSGRFVYLAVPDEEGLATVERRTVSVGELSPRGLEIATGIAEGEFVIIAGVSKVVPGQQVRLLASQRR